MKLKIKVFLLAFFFFPTLVSANEYGTNTIISVIDDSGQLIQLDKPATRVISLAPHLTEMMFFLNQERSLLARDFSSDFPEASKSITDIGNASSLNIEAILALKPDLILAWQSGNKQKQMKQLQNLGIPVFYSEPRKLKDIPSNLNRISILLGALNRNEANIQKLEQALEKTNTRNNGEKIKVFYQVWQEPLMSLNGEHLVSQIIRFCGGENIFSSQSILAPQVSVEAVIKNNPDLIIFGEENIQALDFWKKWPEIKAVKNERLLPINPDILVRPGPRVVQGIEQICATIDSMNAVKTASE